MKQNAISYIYKRENNMNLVRKHFSGANIGKYICKEKQNKNTERK
jgi:hypothetical protein